MAEQKARLLLGHLLRLFGLLLGLALGALGVLLGLRRLALRLGLGLGRLPRRLLRLARLLLGARVLGAGLVRARVFLLLVLLQHGVHFVLDVLVLEVLLRLHVREAARVQLDHAHGVVVAAVRALLLVRAYGPAAALYAVVRGAVAAVRAARDERIPAAVVLEPVPLAGKR